jgi:hypothetical protein
VAERGKLLRVTLDGFHVYGSRSVDANVKHRARPRRRRSSAERYPVYRIDTAS